MHIVILSDHRSFQPIPLAEALAMLRKIPLIDAAQYVRQHWGLVGSDLDPSTSAAWVQALADRKLPARAITADQVTEIPAILFFKSMDIKTNEWTLQLQSGEKRLISPENVALIGACSYYEDHTTTKVREEGPSTAQRLASAGLFMATGLPISIGPKTKKVETKEHHSEMVLHLDIVTRAPTARYRMNGAQFDYSCLGAKKQYHMLGNFRDLLQRLHGQAASAWCNRGTEILLASRPLTEMSYRSTLDLDSELRWLMALQSL